MEGGCEKNGKKGAINCQDQPNGRQPQKSYMNVPHRIDVTYSPKNNGFSMDSRRGGKFTT